MLKKLLLIIIFSFLLTNFSNAKGIYYKCDISKLEKNHDITDEDIKFFKSLSYILFFTDLVINGKLSNGHMSNLYSDWYPEGKMWDGAHRVITLTESLIVFQKINRISFDYDPNKPKYKKAFIIRKKDSLFLSRNLAQEDSPSFIETFSEDKIKILIDNKPYYLGLEETLKNESLFFECLEIDKKDLPKEDL